MSEKKTVIELEADESVVLFRGSGELELHIPSNDNDDEEVALSALNALRVAVLFRHPFLVEKLDEILFEDMAKEKEDDDAQ